MKKSTVQNQLCWFKNFRKGATSAKMCVSPRKLQRALQAGQNNARCEEQQVDNKGCPYLTG